MRKIKDKIIKMLGGVPKKEFTKEVEQRIYTEDGETIVINKFKVK